jgi:hypothetical protein
MKQTPQQLFQNMYPTARLMVVLLPMAIATVIFPFWLSVFVTLATIPVFYFFTEKLQGYFFEIKKSDAFLRIVLPIQLFVLLWAIFLIHAGKVDVFIRTLCVFVGLIC